MELREKKVSEQALQYITAGVCLILAIALFATTASAVIQGSKHDLGALTGSGQFGATLETETCIFCHTPHSASVVPLWNRSLDTSNSWQTYTSSTLNANGGTAPQPTNSSLLCLSCHDGISTMNTLVNYATVNPIAMISGFDKLSDVWIGPGNPPAYPGSNIGEAPVNPRNLTNDHPVSFVFDVALITADQGGAPLPKLQLPAPATGLKLIGPAGAERVECATCHDPHEPGTPAAGTKPFLRMSNTGSLMCLACHIK